MHGKSEFGVMIGELCFKISRVCPKTASVILTKASEVDPNFRYGSKSGYQTAASYFGLVTVYRIFGGVIVKKPGSLKTISGSFLGALDLIAQYSKDYASVIQETYDSKYQIYFSENSKMDSFLEDLKLIWESLYRI